MQVVSLFQRIAARKRKQISFLEKESLLRESGLFDAAWYGHAYPDVRRTGSSLIGHFIEFGGRELRDPGPRFDSEWYRDRYADVRDSDMEPVFHYLTIGRQQGREIRNSRALGVRRTDVLASGFFDAAYYLKTYPDVARSGQDPLEHFVSFGSAEARSPGPLFEAQWYREEYLASEQDPELREPLFHYLKVGKALGYATAGPPAYLRWINLYDSLSSDDVAAIREHIRHTEMAPLVLVIDVDRRSEGFLDGFEAALLDQLHSGWQAFLVVDDGCSDEAVARIDAMARRDARFVSHGRDRTAALEAAASRPGLLFFGRPDISLRSHALYMFSIYAAEEGGDGPLVLYADEDRLDGEGHRSDPTFKPRWSPVLFSNAGREEHSFLLRAPSGDIRALLLDYRSGSGVFRKAVSKGYGAIHIPFVLSHKRLTDAPAPASGAIMPLDNDLPSVSIIIPTKDKSYLLSACLDSLRATTNYPPDLIEVVVVDNGSTDPTTLAYLDQCVSQGWIKLVRQGGVFNFSRLNNIAVRNSSGDVLLFLNNDTEIIEADWLRNMISFVVRPDVGIVGAKLLYPDRSVQHSGIVLGIQGLAAHSFVGERHDGPGFQGLNLVSREVSAVTGACLAIRRNVFYEIGGFDPDLAVAFNDVELCLRVRRAGYSNIWAHNAVLIHHESKSRGFDLTFEQRAKLNAEARCARDKAAPDQFEDPFYSPNLSLQTIYELAHPPRLRKPWAAWKRGRKPRLLMLSSALGFGYGVSVVLKLQAEYLAASGFEVVVAGPRSGSDVVYAGCSREVLETPLKAAIFAARNDIDCVITHTPPFFSIGRYLGSMIPHIAYDYGEPPPALFPNERNDRLEVNLEKRLSFSLATRLAAISEAVRAEADEPNMIVVPLANNHLSVWEPAFEGRRAAIRKRLGWEGKTVILNVCRFFEIERLYKGVDRYMDLAFRLSAQRSDRPFQCVIAGRAGEEDAVEVEAAGVQVFLSVSDETLSELYIAADLYCNFSQWEGYNLGIAQALAMGLPVIASDIPAHRAFPIHVTSDMNEAIELVLSLSGRQGPREAVVTQWEPGLRAFASLISTTIDEWRSKGYPH